jgi:hypothetical protein
MKKLLIAFCFMAFAGITYAQVDLKKPVAPATTPASTAVAQMGKGIVDVLASKLSLTAMQSPKVASIVSTFLTAKSSLTPLMQSKPAEYKTKLASAQTDLTAGMKGALNPEQYTKFLGLKPAQANAANVLSQLFF